ncbi:MAG: phosphate signaling complex protein PhoU [Anaerovoracaceae bacterium]
MVRNRFDSQLNILNTEIIEMGALCEKSIEDAVKALIDNDRVLAATAVEADKKIDQKEKDIESLCLKLLLQQQPVARDLRLISAALKMITDMERIGDQAADIAEIVCSADFSMAKDFEHIKGMAEATTKMVKDCVEAFVERDLVMAREVMDYDDVVDNLFDVVKAEAIDFIVGLGGKSEEEKNKCGVFVMDIMMIAKYFERIGDHATNIAEWVEFSITGTHENLEGEKK